MPDIATENDISVFYSINFYLKHEKCKSRTLKQFVYSLSRWKEKPRESSLLIKPSLSSKRKRKEKRFYFCKLCSANVKNPE